MDLFNRIEGRLERIERFVERIIAGDHLVDHCGPSVGGAAPRYPAHQPDEQAQLIQRMNPR